MSRLLFLLLICLFSAISMSAQSYEALAERIEQQRYEFPQEKIHVMTDRGSYLAGDTIWLRAWIVDAMTHQQVDASKFVYIELLSPTDSVLTRVKIHADINGIYNGYLPLEVDMPEGRYQLTAYTMFMQSVGTEYFYSQPIEVSALPSLRRRIVSKCVRYDNEIDITLRYENTADSSLCPYNTFAYETSDKSWYQQQYNGQTKEQHITLKGKNAQMSSMLVEFDNYFKYIPLPPQERLDLTFYPEGGYLVPEIENVVTFKIHNTSAKAISEMGELIDENGHVVAPLSIEHDGMGIVKFTPRAGTCYKARWRDNFDEVITFDLPVPRPEATVAQVRRDGQGNITARAAGARASDALILIQQRGNLLAAGYDSITVNESDLPAGVVQVLLLDNEIRYLSERLFFANNPPYSEPQVVTDRDAYNDREPVKVSVDLSQWGYHGGDYAVSVIDNQVVEPSESNILVNLLLQSELRGHINQPDYYFNHGDSTSLAQRSQHLDMLMLTQGWRRYDIQRALRGVLAKPQFPIEVRQVVTGRVLSDWRKKPVAGAKISLIAPRVRFSAVTKSDSLGEFVISMPLLPDSVDCIVIAENTKGKKQVNLELDQELFPKSLYTTNDKTTTHATNNAADQEWRLEHSGDWRHIILNELLVSAVRPRIEASDRNPYNLNHRKIEEKGIRSIEDVTYSVPGLIAVNGGLYTPGGTDAKNRVRIVVDGVPVLSNYGSDEDHLDPNNLIQFPTGISVNLSELSIAQSLISFKDVSYIYFARATHGGGTLYVQHREGYQSRRKSEPSIFLKFIKPMGVQTPVEFYSPRYDKDDNGFEPGTDLRAVLYWNPCVPVDGNGKSKFDFYSNDSHNTTYTVTIEGISPNGTLIRATRQVTKH